MSSRFAWFLLVAACGSSSRPGSDALAPPDAARDAAAGDSAADDAVPADGAPVGYQHAPIYYTADGLTFQLPLERRTPTVFGAAGATVALLPSPSRRRLAQRFQDGSVNVYTAEGRELAFFQDQASLLGWIGEEDFLLYNRTTLSLRRVRLDGSEGRNLPNPIAGPTTSQWVVLSPDGALLALVGSAAPAMPASLGTVSVMTTSDGTVTNRFEVPAILGPVWTQDGTLVWVEGRLLARADLDQGTKSLTPLPFEPCSLDAWAGPTVRLGTQVLREDVYACNRYFSASADGSVAALDWLNVRLNVPIATTLPLTVSPDGKKIAVYGIVNGGLNLVNPDGTGDENLVPSPGAVSTLGW